MTPQIATDEATRFDFRGWSEWSTLEILSTGLDGPMETI